MNVYLVAALVFFSMNCFAGEGISNEKLFDDCTLREKYMAGKRDFASGEAVGIAFCLGFISGALAAHSAGKSDRKDCYTEPKIVNDVILDYLAFTRKTFSLDSPADVVVITMMDECYCGKDSDFKKTFCPDQQKKFDVNPRR